MKQMKKRDFCYSSRDGKTPIHAIEWIPAGPIRAILQISHGMVEYINRYDGLARFLCQKGFYVVGNDHLGHGASVYADEDHGFFAEKRGNACLIGDMHSLRKRTQKKYPTLPYFMLGHSMGSFLLRQYVATYGKGLSGVIFMGTGRQPKAKLFFGRLVCHILSIPFGWYHRSPMVNQMAFAGYLDRIKDPISDMDWLSANEDNVLSYLADPWCGFYFTLNAFDQMFLGMERTDPDRIPKDLPILLVSGKEDPVGNYGKDVTALKETYQKKGIRQVETILYPNDRHEILFEEDHMQVYHDLASWMEAVCS